MSDDELPRNIQIQREREKLPVFVREGRPIVRTRNKIRPDWLDRLKRPLLIVARNSNDFEDFQKTWRFDSGEVARVLLTNDLKRIPLTVPLLVLPRGEEDNMIPDFCPVKFWREKGAPVINVPACAMRAVKVDLGLIFPHFPVETNMEADTLIAIAQHRHLDGLNGQ